MNKYSSEQEAYMVNYYNGLSERERRHYAAIEALKLGHGGISYIADLLGCSRKTIIKGIKEVKEQKDYQKLYEVLFTNNQSCICSSFSTTIDSLYNVESDSFFEVDVPGHKVSLLECHQKSLLQRFRARLSKKVLFNIRCEIRKHLSSKGVRKKGGGRKKIIDTIPGIDQAFLDILSEYTAGSPVIGRIKWTNLAPREIAEELEKKYGIKVSNNVVRQLLTQHGFVRRKMKKCRTFKSDPDRDAQFKKITRLKALYRKNNNPVICVDSKKSESIGEVFRAGKVYTTEEIEALDHDFPSYTEGKARLYSVYDLYKNNCYSFITTSSDTTEFACDCIKSWWNTAGIIEYPEATSILVLADAGGSNSCRYNIFKEDLQKVSNEIGIEIRMAHFPPYTSKYNPVDHRVFCHITRACQGVLLTSIELLKELVERTTTKTGLKVVATIVKKTFETKRKASEEFLKNMPIKADSFLGKLNYRAIPQ